MLTHKVHYFIEGRYLASADVPDPFEKVYGAGNIQKLRSYVYICSTCGKEWARIVAEGGNEWQAYSLPCKLHKPVGVWDWSSTPGALTTVLDEDPPIWALGKSRQHLPLAVLKWEFECEYAKFKRIQNEE